MPTLVRGEGVKRCVQCGWARGHAPSCTALSPEAEAFIEAVDKALRGEAEALRAPMAWCSARTSKRCLASGNRIGGAISGPAPVDDLRLCVSCHQHACPPCSVELPDGEWECKPCARRDVHGEAS